MSLSESNLGWFYIGEDWNLYIDGSLMEVHVEHICVDEAPEGEEYVVDHYSRFGKLLTSVKLTADDIRYEVEDRQPTNRPMHV